MTTTAPPVPADESQWYRRYSFNAAWEIGWQTFKTRYSYLLTVSLIYAIIYVPLVLLASVADRALVGEHSLIDPVETLFTIFLLGPLGAGFSYAGASAVRGRHKDLGDLFIAFKRYGTIVVVSVITTLLTMLMFAPAIAIGAIGGSGSSPGPAAMIGLIVLFLALLAAAVAVVYVTIRLWFASLLVIDPLAPRPGAIEALKVSWAITSGRALSLFALAVTVGFVFALTILLAVLPALFLGLPLLAAVFGAAYAHIVAEDGLVPLESSCVNCGYPNPQRGVCPECGFAGDGAAPIPA